jgi:hypothetical protein
VRIGVALKARRRRFAGLTSGSIKPTVAGAFIASAMMLLAGCGGSGGSAAESSAPAIRGDVALPDTSDPGNSAVTSPFDPEVIEGIQNVVANSVGKVMANDAGVIFVDKGSVTIIVGDGKSSETVVKPPVDAPVIILEQGRTDVVLTPDVTEKPTADDFAVVTNSRYEVYVDNVGKYRYWGPFGPGNDALVTVSEAYDTLAAAEMACAWAAQLGVDCLTVVGADN